MSRKLSPSRQASLTIADDLSANSRQSLASRWSCVLRHDMRVFRHGTCVPRRQGCQAGHTNGNLHIAGENYMEYVEGLVYF